MMMIDIDMMHVSTCVFELSAVSLGEPTAHRTLREPDDFTHPSNTVVMVLMAIQS